MAKCIFLTGAPETDALTWNDSALLSDFESPLKRFMGTRMPASAPSIEASTYAMPKWRAASMTAGQREIVEEPDDHDDPQTQFLIFNDNTTNIQNHLHFLEHSFAQMNDTDSSQVAPAADDTTYLSVNSFTTSISSTSLPTTHDSLSTTASLFETTQQINLLGPVTDLRRIPPADHLLRIAPQTVTVNLICAVISVSPSRTVRLRKRNAEMDIIELLVGDETRAGFSISFWLAPTDSQQQTPDDMRLALCQLRAGDVALVQNVALSAFKECVYGQSLNRKFARNSTTVAVVRGGGQGLPVHVRGKAERVTMWRDHFVGSDGKHASSGKTKHFEKSSEEELPPDTQD